MVHGSETWTKNTEVIWADRDENVVVDVCISLRDKVPSVEVREIMDWIGDWNCLEELAGTHYYGKMMATEWIEACCKRQMM